MATETEHYGLVKPSLDEPYELGVVNENTDRVDAALHDMEEGKADLDPVTRKVKLEQLPPQDYDPSGSAAAVDQKLSAHTGKTDNPHRVTAAQVGAIPTGQKGATGGVASLDGTGKVPTGQLPAMNYDPSGSAAAVDQKLGAHTGKTDNPHQVTAAQAGAIPVSQKGKAGGVAELTAAGVVPVSQIPPEAKEVRIVANLDALIATPNRFPGLSVYVKDATGDATVNRGGAYYLWDGSGWIKTSESESMDVVLRWADIQGKPATFPAAAHTHTPAQVGALPVTGGTLTGDLTLKGSGNYGTKINFGDGDYVHLHEISDDKLEIKATNLDLSVSGTATYKGKELSVVGHTHSDLSGKRTCRFVVGTSTAGWTDKDCDYLCDGTADQVEINAAIQALPSAGGEIVILDGTYNITESMLISKADVSIAGAGRPVLKRQFGTDADTLVSISGENFSLQGLVIDGNASEITPPVYAYNRCEIKIESEITCRISRCHILNYQGSGLKASAGYTLVSECVFEKAKYAGIYVAPPARASVSSCIFRDIQNDDSGYGCALYAIGQGGSCGIVFIGNLVESCLYGVLLDSGNDIVITGNRINSIRDCISATHWSRNALISNNMLLTHPGYSGVRLSSVYNYTISSNTIRNADTGIYAWYAGNCCIIGNMFINDAGIALAKSVYFVGAYNINNLVTQNHFWGVNYVSEGGTGNTFTGNKYN